MVATRAEDLLGQKFGHWTVVSRASQNPELVSRSALWVCQCDCEAATTKVVPAGALKSGKSASCGCERNKASSEWHRSHRGELHPNWKGGGWVNVHGYREIMVDAVQVLEHRHVMEQYLGRKLFPEENVHHKNGNRTDNRIENLELWSTSQPSGQRVEDKVKWAKEFLAQYEE